MLPTRTSPTARASWRTRHLEFPQGEQVRHPLHRPSPALWGDLGRVPRPALHVSLQGLPTLPGARDQPEPEPRILHSQMLHQFSDRMTFPQRVANYLVHYLETYLRIQSMKTLHPISSREMCTYPPCIGRAPSGCYDTTLCSSIPDQSCPTWFSLEGPIARKRESCLRSVALFLFDRSVCSWADIVLTCTIFPHAFGSLSQPGRAS